MAASTKELGDCTRDELLSLAKRRGLAGVSNLKKAELRAALESDPDDHRYRPPLLADPEVDADQLTLTAVDSRWCRVEWAFTQQTVSRASHSLGRDWRAAKAVAVVSESDTPLAEAEVDADAEVWYVRLSRPARTELRGSIVVRGEGHSFTLKTTPSVKPAASGRAATAGPLPDSIMEEIHRLHNASDAFPFDIRGELRLVGETRPGTRVVAGNLEAVAAEDGRFSFGVPMEVGRTVLPIEAVSADRGERRSGVAAADLSLKIFDPHGEGE